ATSLGAVWSPAATWVDVHTADVNGDGLADLVGRDQGSGGWWVGRNDGGGAFTTTRWAAWSPGVNWRDVQVADFNGDGRADLVGRWRETGQWWASLSGPAGFTAATRWATWSTAVTWADVRLGDFNGDGKRDLVGRVREYGQWWVGLSTGTAFTTSAWA